MRTERLFHCGRGAFLLSTNLLRARGLKPLILSYAELHRVLWPLCEGYAWGENTLGDLWRRMAPVPGYAIEKRIISPAHLGEWLADVLDKRGLPLDAQAMAYNELVSGAKPRWLTK